MKISYNWLKEFLNVDIEHQKLAEILTNIGLEVEGTMEFESVKGGLKGLIVGEVMTCEKHPDADKLSVTTVDTGKEELLHIVCGAPNVAKGQKVVVAPVGITLQSANGEFTLKKTKIRGQVSEGMICAMDEIGMGEDHEGIIVLDEKAVVGSKVSDYFEVYDDVVFEIGLTPNRIDAASHFGVARDLYAFFLNNDYKGINLKKPASDNFSINSNNRYIPVELANTEACPRYCGITISGIEVKESPMFIQNKLKAIGLKPINNIVDITNYVLHEIGHPLHAFDADKIKGNKVVVRTLKDKTKFITLDNEEIELSSEDLMICNTEAGMCIAGVYGGIESGVSEQTKNIFLESAYFNPVWVRKTAKRHGLSTDSSFRFERGADPNNTLQALKRAAAMIREVAGGEISSDIVDIYPQKINETQIDLSLKQVERLIGKHISKNKILKILESLDIEIITENDDLLRIEIPTYRVDVQREADVIEEILRIYGYNNVEIPEEVHSTLSYTEDIDYEKIRNIISDYLSSNGFNESMSNSLTKSAYYENLKEYSEKTLVKLLNPLSTDLNSMRQTLLFGALEAVIRNINHKNYDLKLYEFGNCYYLIKEKSEFKEKYFEAQHLSIFITGNSKKVNWNSPERKSDFYHLKAYCENILQLLGFEIDQFTINDSESEFLSYGISYKLNNQYILYLGSVKSRFLRDQDIDQEVYYADFEWDIILKNIPKVKKYRPLAKFPEVKRDLALLIDENITFARLKEIAHKTERNYLKEVSIFDVYKDEKIGKGKKSYALSFTLLDENKTFTETQIEKIMSRLMDAYKKEVDAEIR